MSDASEEPDFLAVRCEHCEARLRVRAKLAGKLAKCPNCDSPIVIPVRPLIEFQLPTEDDDGEQFDESGGYRLAEPLQHEPDHGVPEPLPAELQAPAPEKGYLEQVERVRQNVVEAPPQFLFFSGIFDFPWYPEVWLRWGYLVLGGCLASMIPVLALALLEGSSNYVGVGAAFFAMPQIWITLWSGSFMAACGIQIFEDTAAGSDHITAWPDPNWREWMWPLMYMGYVALMVLAVAYGISRVCGGNSNTILLTLVLSEFFLFPICLLSVLEANNLAILFSPRLLLSLIHKPLGWLLFYFITGSLFAAWGGLIWFISPFSPLFAIVVNGLLYASIGLIWFRLLGRLAWLIIHSRSKKRRKNAPTSAKVRRVTGES